MITNVYSIRDTLAEIFNQPFCEINNATAIRAFSSAMLEKPNKDDYILCHIGTYDDLTGQHTVNEPVKIFSGLDVRKEDK